jgi:hypothetical protein
MSVRADVDRGLEIVKQIDELKAELEKIETRLEKAGLEAGSRGEHQALKDVDREGKCWQAKGSAVSVPMIFTSDKIVSSFTANGAKHTAIAAAAGGHLREFFKPVNKYENLFDDGKKFRAHAAEVLAGAAPAFITACVATDKSGIPKSDIKILWGEVEEINKSDAKTNENH